MKKGYFIEVPFGDVVAAWLREQGIKEAPTGMCIREGAVCIFASSDFTDITSGVYIAADTTDAVTLAKKMLRREEGRVMKVYKDSLGYLTAGIGHLITASDRAKYPELATAGTPITEQQCDEWFAKDTADAENTAKNWLGASNYEKLSSLRQALVICMAFQLGAATLKEFVETREHIIRGEWNDVATHILNTKWAKQTPNRVDRMAKMFVSDNMLPYYD